MIQSIFKHQFILSYAASAPYNCSYPYRHLLAQGAGF